MKFTGAPVLFAIALLLGNSLSALRASVTGTAAQSDGDPSPECQCETCCEGPQGIPGQNGNSGPKGEAGLPGQKGDVGPIGPKGEQGPMGHSGRKGERGVGQPGEKGSRGPQGVVGATGLAGVKGQKGDLGETPDASNQRVAFTVARRTDFTSSAYPKRLPFQDTETLLPGTNFDLQTGTFTCSVPGTYVFMFSALKEFNSGDLWVHLGKNYDLVVTAHSDTTNGQEHVSGSAVLVLQPEDVVYLTMFGEVDGSSYHHTSFSGFLLYPE